MGQISANVSKSWKFSHDPLIFGGKDVCLTNSLRLKPVGKWSVGAISCWTSYRQISVFVISANLEWLDTISNTYNFHIRYMRISQASDIFNGDFILSHVLVIA